MSVISDFAAKQKAFNERQGAAIDTLVTSSTDMQTSLSGIQGDIKTLNDLIEKLQTNPDDEATLKELEAAGDALATRLEASANASKVLSDAAKALDAQTPPAVPA